MAYKFEEKLDTDTPIDWWNECRRELNKIIKIYNDWQIDFFPTKGKRHLLAMIEYGKQTIGSTDGGDMYLEILERMQNYVNEATVHS